MSNSSSGSRSSSNNSRIATHTTSSSNSSRNRSTLYAHVHIRIYSTEINMLTRIYIALQSSSSTTGTFRMARTATNIGVIHQFRYVDILDVLCPPSPAIPVLYMQILDKIFDVMYTWYQISRSYVSAR